MIRPFIALALGAAIASGAAGANPGARMDEYLQPLVAQRELNGSVLVAKNDRVLFARGYGYADRRSGRLNTPETFFRIPGMLLFNSVAVYQLRDRGRLALTDSVCRFVPRCPAAWRPIAVESLLSATSGLPAAWNLPGRPTIARAVAWLRSRPLQFSVERPGHNHDLSPSPQILLSYVIERASGQAWLAYLREHIFTPAGMRSTMVTDEVPVSRRATGYLLPGLQPGRDVELTRPDPAHGLWTTVGDMFRFDRALYAVRLLRPQSREELFPSAAHTVMGMHGYDRVQGRVRDGWYSLFAHHAPDRIFVVLLMNGRKAQYRFYEIELALAGLAAGAAVRLSPVTLPPDPAIAFTGELGVVTVSAEDGSQRVALTAPYAGRAWSPVWSKDGSRLLFSRCRGDRCSAYVVRSNGLGEKRIASGMAIAWAPDGNAAVVDGKTVWLVSADGRTKRRATAPGLRDARGIVAFSPDGRHLLYTQFYGPRGGQGHNRLLITDLMSGETRELRKERGFYLISPAAWSPDGTSIVFTRRPSVGSFGGGAYTTSADGSNLRLVASDAGHGPAWSPDGERLAYNVGISCKVRIVALDGSAVSTLRYEACFPMWRPGR
jgi:CubicO group peptidase (beta-lactamase class C family)